MVKAAVGLGSNQGDRLANLRYAVGRLAELGKIVSVSSLYESDPVGGPDQGTYLNAVVVVETELDAHRLLDGLLEIEAAAGRVRRERWGPRTLDLDLLLYGTQRIRTERLTVPHPRLEERRFVLEPLRETWPGQAPQPTGLDGQQVSRVLDPGWAQAGSEG